MDSSSIPLLVSIVGGMFAIMGTFVGAYVNARTQERTANLRVDADLRLQADRLRDTAVSADLALRRTKLEELYVFLSDVAAQCSETQVQLDYQMGRDLEKQTARWTELRDKMGRARAATVTFPDIFHHMAEIEGSIDRFYWTSRTLLQQDHDLQGDHEGWDRQYEQVIKTSSDAASAVSKVKRELEKEARRLAEMAPLFEAQSERFFNSRTMSSPRFKCIIKRDVIVLTELEPQGISITNAAEGIVRDLVDRAVLDPLRPRRIVYLDQLGQWDGLAVHEGTFAGFVMLGARSEEEAIQAAIHSDWNAHSL